MKRIYKWTFLDFDESLHKIHVDLGAIERIHNQPDGTTAVTFRGGLTFHAEGVDYTNLLNAWTEFMETHNGPNETPPV
jgi:hypothetical protein